MRRHGPKQSLLHGATLPPLTGVRLSPLRQGHIAATLYAQGPAQARIMEGGVLVSYCCCNKSQTYWPLKAYIWYSSGDF